MKDYQHQGKASRDTGPLGQKYQTSSNSACHRCPFQNCGNVFYQNLVEDRFAPILIRKLIDLGFEVDHISFTPDNTEIIRQAICVHVERSCELLLLSGGMSVDPDDVTRKGIRLVGADAIHYCAVAPPGAMFLVAYIGKVSLIGVPAFGFHHRTTVLDLVLSRILAEEKIGKKELAFLGHGGLCRDYAECTYPHCAFGKGN